MPKGPMGTQLPAYTGGSPIAAISINTTRVRATDVLVTHAINLT